MRRTFVTFHEGEEYAAAAAVLSESVAEFSDYPITQYGAADLGHDWSPEGWPSGFAYKFKLLACLKALEEHDEVVWLDSDVVVSHRIDRIWENRVDDYPLMPMHRFNNFIRWPYVPITPDERGRDDFGHPEFLPEGKTRVGITEMPAKPTWRQACVMLINRRCTPFLKDALSYFEGYSDLEFRLGDETIMNLLLWKYGHERHLGDISLCSFYFSDFHITRALAAKGPQELQDLFSPSVHAPEEEGWFIYGGADYRQHNRIGIIDCGVDILFLHGSKGDAHRKYLEKMKEIRDAERQG